MPLKVVTLNLLSDPLCWEQRSRVLINGLDAVGADLLALQEVNLKLDIAPWLAKRLGYPYVHLTPKTGKEAKSEGLAIFSRIPFEARSALDLESQNRVAQFVSLRSGDQLFGLANGHFYWQPGESKERQHQVQRLLDWLEPYKADYPVVVCGDFNAGPEDAAVRQMKLRFHSAFATQHGREPDYTYPTKLPRSRVALLRTLLAFWREIRLSEVRLDWHSTLDYIFVDPRVEVLECHLILDEPDSENPNLYASDHFGLLAILSMRENNG